MAKKLFISNLDFEVTVEQLRELFETVGGSVSISIPVDRETKRSKGFGFVEMQSEEDAKKAIEALNGKPLNNRPIKVNEDRGKPGFAPRSEGGAPAGEGGEGGRPRFEPLPPIQRTQLFRRKKKLDPFIEDPTKTIDYKDTTLLSKFVSERGKILSRRLTGLSAYNQRKLAKAIKRAQNLGLMGFSNV